MTANRPPLTDPLLRLALTELAAGPDSTELVGEVLRTVNVTPQARGLPWRRDASGRRTLLVLAAGLLLVALIGAIAVFSGILPSPNPVPIVPQTIVLEQWIAPPGDRSVDLSTITHTAVTPDGSHVALDALPIRASTVRWSPDGRWLTYIKVERTGTWRGPPAFYQPVGLVLADGDGTDPLNVSVPRDPQMYSVISPDWLGGPVWAPSGRLFALGWDAGGCLGLDCVSDTGIDIFDTDGQLVVSIVTHITLMPESACCPVWSPDSERIGWVAGSCTDRGCEDVAFHWRLVTGDESIHALPLGGLSTVAWSASDRLMVVTTNETGMRVYSMTRDGTDEQNVAWEAGRVGRPVWSPDGRRIATVDSATGRLTIRDARTGQDVEAEIPTELFFAKWSPDSDRVVLAGYLLDQFVGDHFVLYTVNADGTGVVRVGEAWDFAWMPT